MSQRRYSKNKSRSNSKAKAEAKSQADIMIEKGKEIMNVLDRTNYEILNLDKIKAIRNISAEAFLSDFSLHGYKKPVRVWVDPSINFLQFFPHNKGVCRADGIQLSTGKLLNVRPVQFDAVFDEAKSQKAGGDELSFLEKLGATDLLDFIEENVRNIMDIFVSGMHEWRVKPNRQLKPNNPMYGPLHLSFKQGVWVGLRVFYMLASKLLFGGPEDQLSTYSTETRADMYKCAQELLDKSRLAPRNASLLINEVPVFVLDILSGLKRSCLQQGVICGALLNAAGWIGEIYGKNEMIHELFAGYVDNLILAMCVQDAVDLKRLLAGQ
jgi:hypothetical protein